MALSCGPASTVSYANHVQPIALSVPTARASPSHGNQSHTHSFPGEQYKDVGMPCGTAVLKPASRTPRRDVSSCHCPTAFHNTFSSLPCPTIGVKVLSKDL